MTERSRKRAVKTIKKDNPRFFQEIGSIGGNNSPTKFTSNTGRNAANIRWERKRAEELKLRKETQNDGHQVQST